MAKINPDLSRRRLIACGIHGAALLALSGCQRIFDGLSQNQTVQSILTTAERASLRVHRAITPRGKLAQEFTERDISPTFRANGNPPPTAVDYLEDANNQWMKWRLEVSGLVERPGRFSLADLKSMPSRTQITRHDCVEGWSVIGKWKGVRLEKIIDQVRPLGDARYIVFRCMDVDGDGTHYYESIDLVDAAHPQTILAYELNDLPLPVDNGAPLRLRVETQLGYKHAKYIGALEFVAGLDKLGKGKGGYWEDQGYEWYAGI